MVKHALVYLALVGGPCLGLLWILHVGASLTAAPTVEGAWVISGPACLTGEQLRLDQSGRYLQIDAPRAWAHLDADGRLDARFEVRVGPCAGRTASVTAHTDSERQRLDGTVRIERCDACDGPAPFVGERLPD